MINSEDTQTLANEIWIATATLHRENPAREDFFTSEIREKVLELFRDHRPGVQPHVSYHCVANKPAKPANHRFLFQPGPKRRRLFDERTDSFDPSRASGAVIPKEEELQLKYLSLLDWYRREFRKEPATENRPQNPTSAMDVRAKIKSLSQEQLAYIGEQYLMTAIDHLQP